MVQTTENNIILNTIIYKESDDIKLNRYINGRSLSSDKQFKRIRLNEGMFIGETFNNSPNGWGILFQRDGYMWYGKWENGKRNGIGGLCDFDGSNYKVGIWKNNNFII